MSAFGKDSASLVWFVQSMTKTPLEGHEDIEWVEEADVPSATITMVAFKASKTWSEVREIFPGTYVRPFKVPFFDEDTETVAAGASGVADVIRTLVSKPDWRAKVGKIQVDRQLASRATPSSNAGKGRPLPRRR